MAFHPLFMVMLLATCSSVDAATLARGGSSRASSAAATSVNPIRKVVNLLKGIEKKINEEMATKLKLYDEYMCYCKNSDGTLSASIAESENAIPMISSKIKEDSAAKTQTETELKDAQTGREEAKEQIAQAEKLRASTAEKFAKESSDLKTNIAALTKAIPAIESGMSGAFLQTSGASALKRISITADIGPSDRDLLTSFLSGSSGYVPQSGEIVGILKTIKDEMEKELAEITAAEESSITSFDDLVAAKKKEIAAQTKAIEAKSVKIGDLGVAVAQAENDLENTKESLAEDQKFLATLGEGCDTKTKEWEEYKKMSGEELVAITETIKVLNDDDALEIFKKTLPAAGSSLVQVKATARSVRHRVLEGLASKSDNDPRVDLIQMALHGGKIGFEKIIKMIDELVATLKTEQADDDDKKTYCLAEFDKSEDAKKGLDRDMSDLDAAIADGKDAMATLKGEIKALAKQIKELDGQVSEATATRKEEHDDYVKTMAEDKAAKEILEFAMNRLNKFYNPNLYIAPPKVELEFSQIHAKGAVAPPPPPEANLAYKKKEASKGVIALISGLIKDLEKEDLELTGEEKGAQAMYEKYMAEAADKRASMSSTSVSKESVLAETESDVMMKKDSLKSKTTEDAELAKYVSSLHAECDWLLKYHDARMAARTAEIESLGNAKAVLSGADYSLIQMQPAAHLRGSHQELRHDF